MNFNYKYKVKIWDLWQASMYYAYSSFLAVINVACIISSVILIIKFWGNAGEIARLFMALYFSAFTIIQPTVVYFRAKSSLNGNYPEIDITFSAKGITIISGGQLQNKEWKDIINVVKRPTIVIVYMKDGAGYILRNSVLSGTRKEFLEFVGKMKKQ